MKGPGIFLLSQDRVVLFTEKSSIRLTQNNREKRQYAVILFQRSVELILFSTKNTTGYEKFLTWMEHEIARLNIFTSSTTSLYFLLCAHIGLMTFSIPFTVNH